MREIQTIFVTARKKLLRAESKVNIEKGKVSIEKGVLCVCQFILQLGLDILFGKPMIQEKTVEDLDFVAVACGGTWLVILKEWKIKSKK